MKPLKIKNLNSFWLLTLLVSPVVDLNIKLNTIIKPLAEIYALNVTLIWPASAYTWQKQCCNVFCFQINLFSILHPIIDSKHKSWIIGPSCWLSFFFMVKNIKFRNPKGFGSAYSECKSGSFFYFQSRDETNHLQCSLNISLNVKTECYILRNNLHDWYH